MAKESVSMKIKELMIVLQIEVSKRYTPYAFGQMAAMPKVPKLKDTKLD